LLEGDALLRELDALQPHHKVFLNGNHENRLHRAVIRHAPQLDGLVSIDEILGLTARGWRVVPYRDGVTIGDTFWTHDLERAGQAAVRHARQDIGGKVVIGHVHRLETVHAGDRHGVPLFARCFGWLGSRTTAADYRHIRRASKDYHHGFGWGYMAPDGTTWLHAAPIENGRCEVGGMVFGVERVA